jgi:hypothetical protein
MEYTVRVQMSAQVRLCAIAVIKRDRKYMRKRILLIQVAGIKRSVDAHTPQSESMWHDADGPVIVHAMAAPI